MQRDFPKCNEVIPNFSTKPIMVLQERESEKGIIQNTGNMQTMTNLHA